MKERKNKRRRNKRRRREKKEERIHLLLDISVSSMYFADLIRVSALLVLLTESATRRSPTEERRKVKADPKKKKGAHK